MVAVVIGFAVLVWGGMAAFGIYVWLKVRRSTGSRRVPVRDRVDGARTAQDFLGFEAIRGGDAGYVKLDDYHFRAYVLVEPINFWFLSTPEQQAVEAGYRAFLDSLRYPVQIHVSSQPLDLRDHLERIEKGAEGLPEKLRAYATELSEFTAAWVAEHAPITRRSVIVVAWDFSPHPEKPVRPEIVEQQAIQELETRCNIVIEGLRRAKLTARRMSEDQIIAYLYQVYNRGPTTALVARNLLEQDLYQMLYVSGEPGGAETENSGHQEGHGTNEVRAIAGTAHPA